MVTLINFACCLFILFHFPSCSFSYTFNGYEIRDLEGDSSCFLSQVSLWTASRTKTNITYSICNGTYLLGGYDILGTLSSPAWYEDNFKKSYSSLPTTHTMIYFSLTVYALDNWGNGTNTNDTFALDFDTKRVVGPFLKQTNFPTDMCARSGYNDLGPIKVMGRVLHSGSTLTLKLVDMLAQDSNSESVAFRDINLLFSATTTTETSCSRASISFTGSCPCPAGQFLFSTNNCVACHPNCAECFGSGADQCYQCAPGSSWVSGSCVNCDASCRVCNGPGSSQCNACPQGLFYFQSKECIPECPLPFTQVVNACGNTCNSPCSGSNFLFANNSCLPSCPFPLQTTTVYTTVNKCINPCTYGEYLFWDGTCKTSCIAPLKIRNESGVDYCDYKCNSNQYLYWNGSCSATCAPPLVQRFDKSRQFCVYPCQSQEYLYYNGSCLASCPLPFISKTTNNKNFCYHPCPDPSSYIYWNNTCLSSCPSPLNPYLLGGIKYCSKTCPNNQYLFWNDSCIDSCDPPLRITTGQNQVQRCLYPCNNPLEFYDDSTGLCKTTCETQPTNEGGLYFRCPPTKYSLLVDLLLVAPLQQGAGSFVILTKLTQHVKYMNATFSPRLQGIIASKGRPIISLRLGMSMPDSLQRHFTEYTLPDVFESANLHSSFLVNYWQELTSIFIVVGLSLLNMLINLLSRKYRCQRLESFSNKVKFIPAWNYLLMLFATGLDDIILFSALEFQTFHLDSVLGFVSFIVCLIMLVVAVGMLTIFFIFATKAQTARVETQSNRLLVSYKLFVARWQAFQVLFRGFNTENYFDYLFFFFYTIRISFPSIIYSSSYSSPVLEAIVYLLISVIILAYVIYLKPIVDKINHIQLLITEVIVLFMNIILLILAAQGSTATLDSAIIYLGDAIILSNVCLNLLTVVFLVIKLSYQVKEAIALRKQGSDKEMEAWTKTLFIFVQQGGMGFEQAEYIDFANKNPMAIHIQGSLIDNISRQNKSSDQLAVSEENGFNEIQIEDIKLTQNMNEEIVMFMSPDNSVNAVTPNETMINQQNQDSVEPEGVDRLDILQR